MSTCVRTPRAVESAIDAVTDAMLAEDTGAAGAAAFALADALEVEGAFAYPRELRVLGSLLGVAAPWGDSHVGVAVVALARVTNDVAWNRAGAAGRTAYA